MNLDQFLADAAAVATTLGFPAAAIAVYFGLKSLRTEAGAARLESIITTNDLWKEVSSAVEQDIELSPITIESIQRAYSTLNDVEIRSVTAGTGVRPFKARVPFVAAALLPIGNGNWDRSPTDEVTYLRDVRRRTLGLGFVRTVLAEESLSPWLAAEDREQVSEDLRGIDAAMTVWVGRMNEVAELYQENLLDRRLFVSKRSVTLIQQLFAAEPYILWRNSTTPGRWGLRPLGLGSEARLYHWGSHLQRAAIRLRVDPLDYAETETYSGFSKQLGWIVGPGSTPNGQRERKHAERQLMKALGSGFNDDTKSAQNELIASLPINSESGLETGLFEWIETTRNPNPTEIQVHLLGLRDLP